MIMAQNHPTVGMITAVCSFAPAPTVRMAAGGAYVGSSGTAIGANAYGEAIPIWGNKWVRTRNASFTTIDRPSSDRACVRVCVAGVQLGAVSEL